MIQKRSIPWKKAGALTAAAVLSLTVLGSAVFAATTVKLIVNGKELIPDAKPHILNGRVMVPISFIAKALGAKVNWDARTKTVSITTEGSAPTDVWNSAIDEWDVPSLMLARNAALTFLMKHDSRDQTGRELLAENYKSDVPGYTPDAVFPSGGMFPNHIHYDIIDATSSHYDWVFRVNVYQYSNIEGDAVNMLPLNIYVQPTTNLIKEVTLAGDIVEVGSFSPFPGFTVGQ